MFAFELWREFKLSIAEIYAVFPNIKIIFSHPSVLMVENISETELLENAKKLWGTIKIIQVKEVHGDTQEILENHIDFSNYEGKFHYAINTFGEKKNTKDFLKISKQVIKSHGFNPRFINADGKNIPSVAIIKEALVKRKSDFNFIYGDEKVFFGKTIWVQDIYGYSNRDYGKQRDMNIWMLPPKLAQMMINISGWKMIYDPFVGLGTVLIESVYMGNSKVFWSDLNPRMVETAHKNIENLKKDFSFTSEIFTQNAKYIHEITQNLENFCIVSEWYLWEVMTKNNISFERIQKQREKLVDLYEWFFSWLQKLNFKGNIVMSFPFWEMKWKYFYFEEIYDIIGKYTNILPLLPENLDISSTKSGSLLYKRDSQLVGREIFTLQLK